MTVTYTYPGSLVSRSSGMNIVLEELLKEPKRPKTTAELASSSGKHSSHVSRELTKLKRLGLVKEASIAWQGPERPDARLKYYEATAAAYMVMRRI